MFRKVHDVRTERNRGSKSFLDTLSCNKSTYCLIEFNYKKKFTLDTKSCQLLVLSNKISLHPQFLLKKPKRKTQMKSDLTFAPYHQKQLIVFAARVKIFILSVAGSLYNCFAGKQNNIWRKAFLFATFFTKTPKKEVQFLRTRCLAMSLGYNG